MQVVDAVEVHVLRVPGKCGLPHAKVEVRSVDTLDNDATLLLHHIQQCVEVADVPLLNILDGDNNHFLISIYSLQQNWFPQSISNHQVVLFSSKGDGNTGQRSI